MPTPTRRRINRPDFTKRTQRARARSLAVNALTVWMQAFPSAKPAILLDFAVDLKLPCSSPAVHCPLSKNRRECRTLQRTIRRTGDQAG